MSVVVTAVFEPFAVSGVGLKEQVEYAGRPEQLRFNVPVKPPTGVTVIIDIPELPAAMLKEVGLAETENPGAAITT